MGVTDDKKLQELKRYFKPKDKAFIMAALPYLEIEEIAKILGKSKANVKTYIRILEKEKILLSVKTLFSEAQLQKWFGTGKLVAKKRRHGRRNALSGTRKDLDNRFFRSKMEANLARILNLKYGKDTWLYENEWFELTPSTRGKHKNYLPDFKVMPKGNADSFYIEVKGHFSSGDVAKMRKFIKEYPQHTVVFMTTRYSKKVHDFAEKYNCELWVYEDLAQEWSSKIPEWE